MHNSRLLTCRSYLYGGINPKNLTIYDDVYVLSLPAFKWIQVYGPGESPRWGHTCHFIGNRQMLTVGGALDRQLYNIETTGATVNTSTLTCDWEYEGVAIYDMTELIWGSVFDAYAAPYQVPAPVVSIIGGSGIGNATLTQPEAGFAQTAVATMFESRDTVNATQSSPLPSSSVRPAASQGGNHAGTIAGSVLGGIVALGLVIGMVRLFFVKDTKRKPRQQQDMPQMSELDTNDDAKPTHHEFGEEQLHEVGEDGSRHELADHGAPRWELPNTQARAELGPIQTQRA